MAFNIYYKMRDQHDEDDDRTTSLLEATPSRKDPSSFISQSLIVDREERKVNVLTKSHTNAR